MKKRENNPSYNEYLEYWEQTRIMCKGMKSVQEYLLPVVPQSVAGAAIRNRDYKRRAKYYNFPGRTLNGFLGAIFRKPPEITLTPKLEELQNNITASGENIDQFAQSVVKNDIEIGRHGLYIDYIGEGESGRPAIKEYKAESISNWETDDQNNPIEIILEKGKGKYKKLSIENGVYNVKEYDDKGQQVGVTITPKKYDGSIFDYIPFVFCGSVNNTPSVDDIPLWPITDITQGHYQNSADYEDILRFMLPTVALTVPNAQWKESVLGGGEYAIGSGAILPMPPQGSAVMLQANDTQVHENAMRHKEESLIMLGAQLISDRSRVAETEQTVRIKYSSENSVLDTIARNASDAIETALRYMCDFTGEDKETISFELNREFWDTTLSPQLIASIIMLQDRGDIAQQDARALYRKGGVIASGRSNEDIDADVADSSVGL